jgi:hypothetical protein
MGPDQGSCDGRPAVQACSDLLENKNDHMRPTLAGLCVGTYSDDLCDREGALGGCECADCENGRTIEWMFPDPANDINTAEDVMAACGTLVFVSP